MKKRKPLSKRTRFEVFKRDGFRCVYCGGNPPAVILHIDHIIPVAAGGTDAIENLASCCQDCNSGKSDKPLGAMTKPLSSANIASERERIEQATAYNDFLIEKNKVREEWFREISAFWCIMDGQDPDKFSISGDRAIAVRRFLKYLPPEEIKEAIEIASERMGHKTEYQRHKYFCGICWRKINGPKHGGEGEQ